MNILRFFKENSLCIGRDIFRTQLNAVSRFYNALLNKQFAQNLQKVEQILVENKESLEAVVKEAIKRGNESNLGGKTEICTYLKARVIGDRTAVITHLLPLEDV
ncbi:TPA: hypothetical protein H1005_00815, partial [archaeon]|nr:hypothetical protein [Candidatus Naiadarchaeales archaeon SRR2090153.bin1042]